MVGHTIFVVGSLMDIKIFLDLKMAPLSIAGLVDKET
jgi:hypothetical protein